MMDKAMVTLRGLVDKLEERLKQLENREAGRELTNAGGMDT